MGGKGVANKIRRINKGKKPHEPVYDPELLPPGSIIAVDISTILVPFVKSNEGAAQANAMPKQSVTSVIDIDKLEVIYIKRLSPSVTNCYDKIILIRSSYVGSYIE